MKKEFSDDELDMLEIIEKYSEVEIVNDKFRAYLFQLVHIIGINFILVGSQYFEDDTAGKFCYYRDEIKTCELRIEIEIGYAEDMSILAHELGHYFSILINSDRTEDSADEVEIKLIRECFNINHYQKYIYIYYLVAFPSPLKRYRLKRIMEKGIDYWINTLKRI